MKWPLPQDFNEAIQNPGVTFADPDLKAGETAAGPTGVPLPHSGNYADVYQLHGPDGRSWAVKCFTRPVFGLAVRYAQVAEELARADLKFTVGFTFLADGIRVRGEWRPVIKMEWVAGRPLNHVVEDHADNPKVLRALGHRWGRLCAKLRAAGIAHGDIQHGNVLLVPGSKSGSYGLKLVDYDGMYVPALANVPSGEAGHPNFQHPERLATRAYSADLDRFPHLVVVTALKALEAGGRALWGRYDNGDNLLFAETDFRDPAASPVLRELWQSGRPGVQALVGRLAVACRRPLSETPWVDEVAPDGEPLPLDPDTEREAIELLDMPAAFTAGWVPDVPVLEGQFTVDPEGPSLGEWPNEPLVSATTSSNDRVVLDAAELNRPAEPEGAQYDQPVPESAESDGERKRPRPSPAPAKADRRPAAGGRRAARRRSGGQGVSPGLIVGLVLLVAGVAGGAALLIAAKKRGPTPDDQASNANTIPGLDPRPTEPIPRPALRDPIVPPPSRDPITPPPDPGEMVDPATLPRLKTRWESAGGGTTISRTAFTSDGSLIVAAAYGRRELSVIDARSGVLARTFGGHDGPVVGVAPLPNGQFISLAQDAGFALVWAPATGRQLRRMAGPLISRQAEPFVYTSPDGRYLLTGGTESDNWQAAPQNPSGATVRDRETNSIFSVPMRWGIARITSDSARLVVANDKTGLVQQYDLPAGKEQPAKAEGNIEPALAIAVSPDGRHVVYLGHADRPDLKRYHVYEAGTGRRVRTLPLRPTAGFRTGFSPSGQWLILVHSSGDAARGNEAVFVDTATWTPVAAAPVGDTRGIQWDHGHRFTPDGSTLVVPKGDGGLIAFDVPPDAAAARKLGSRP